MQPQFGTCVAVRPQCGSFVGVPPLCGHFGVGVNLTCGYYDGGVLNTESALYSYI